MAGERQRFCPICDRSFIGGEAVLRCGVCGLLQHPGCWVKNHGCSGGCVGAAQPEPLAYEMAGSPATRHPAEGTRVMSSPAAGTPLPGARSGDPLERVSPGGQASQRSAEPAPPGDAMLGRPRPNAAPPHSDTEPRVIDPPPRAQRGRLSGTGRPPVEDLRLYRRHEFLRYWYVPVAALLAVGIAVGVIWGSDQLLGGGDDSPAAPDTTPSVTSSVPVGSGTTSPAAGGTAAATTGTPAATTGSPGAGTPTQGPVTGGQAAVVAGLDGDCLNLRTSPGTSSAAVDCLAEGTEVSIVGEPEESGGITWVRIQSDSGHDGWVADEYLERQ